MLTEETGELRFIEALRQRGYETIERAEGYFPDWDIKTERATYEIKTDVMAPKTGNVFVEFEYRHKPSGIAATKADYFVVIIEDYAHLTLVTHWRDFIRQHWTFLKKVRGGDNGWSTGVLIDVGLVTRSRITSLDSWFLPQIPEK